MSAENRTAKNPDRDKLIGALNTIKETLVSGDLESVRSAIVKVDSNLTQRLEALEKKTAEATGRNARDTAERIERLEKSQQKALADLSRQLQEAQSNSEDRVRTLKNGLEQVVQSKEEALRVELGSLGQGLSALQLELQRQAEATQHISGLLNNMATVFSAPATPVAVGAEDEESLDNAVDRVFDTDQPPRS